jgi:hypothetical protein
MPLKDNMELLLRIILAGFGVAVISYLLYLFFYLYLVSKKGMR